MSQVGITDGNGRVVYNPQQYLENLRQMELQERVAALRQEAQRLAEEARAASRRASLLNHVALFMDGFMGTATPSYSATVWAMRQLGVFNEAEYQQFAEPHYLRNTGAVAGLFVAVLLPTGATNARHVMWSGRHVWSVTASGAHPAVLQFRLGTKVVTWTQAAVYPVVVTILTAMGEAIRGH